MSELPYGTFHVELRTRCDLFFPGVGPKLCKLRHLLSSLHSQLVGACCPDLSRSLPQYGQGFSSSAEIHLRTMQRLMRAVFWRAKCL